MFVIKFQIPDGELAYVYFIRHA